MKTAVADVPKNLLSVSQLVDAGYEVVFSPEKSVIRNLKTGRVKEIERLNGIYEVSYQMEPYTTALEPGGLQRTARIGGGTASAPPALGPGGRQRAAKGGGGSASAPPGLQQAEKSGGGPASAPPPSRG